MDPMGYIPKHNFKHFPGFYLTGDMKNPQRPCPAKTPPTHPASQWGFANVPNAPPEQTTNTWKLNGSCGDVLPMKYWLSHPE